MRFEEKVKRGGRHPGNGNGNGNGNAALTKRIKQKRREPIPNSLHIEDFQKLDVS